MPQNWDMRRTDAGGDHCPECRAQVEGGRGGCQALFDEITYATQTDLRLAAIHRLALDTYCMQHVESYCASAKSYAAHLIGLCWAIDHPSDPAPVALSLRLVNLNANIVKPTVLSDRGEITLPTLMTSYLANGDVDELVQSIHAWANVVWVAYASQHEIARAWLRS